MDEMFFRGDGKSLIRGKRRERRTPTCRPCVLWLVHLPELKMEGVVMDVNKFGLCVRMIGSVEVGEVVHVQLMADEEFKEALAEPMEAVVRRVQEDGSGFLDHGLEIVRKEIRRTEPKRIVVAPRPRLAPRQRPRMHTLDVTVGDRRGDRRR